MLRLILFVLILASLSIIPFMFWGADLEAFLTIDGAAEWMRGYGNWAWLVGIGLIASDIALPVPATGIMAALGIIYGPVVGGALSSTGSVAAGLLGYGLCRLISKSTAERLAGSQNITFVANLFNAWGGWIVAASRWLPVLPETVSFLAGLARMPFYKYLVALGCGAIPMAFTFSTAGYLGSSNPIMTIAICAFAPLVLWLLVRPYLAQYREN